MTPQAADRQPMGEPGRIANVFLDPKAAFTDIAERPRPWVALALLIVFSVAYMAAFSHRVGWTQFMEQQAERSPQAQNMSADQRAKAGEIYAKMGGVMDKIMPALPVIIDSAVYAAGGRRAGADIPHHDGGGRHVEAAFGITAYAWLPDLLMSAAAIAVLFLKEPEDFNFENPVAFNIGAFLDPANHIQSRHEPGHVHRPVLVLENGSDRAGDFLAARRMTFGKALAGVILPWVLVVLVKSGWPRCAVKARFRTLARDEWPYGCNTVLPG